MKTHDLTHNTDWYWTFIKWYEYAKQNYISPVSDLPPEWITFYYDPTVRFNVKTLLARPWLLMSWFLIPHDSRMAGLIYEGAKRRFLVQKSDGSAYFTGVSGSLEEDSYSTSIGISLAKEFMDTSLYAQLRKSVESNYHPTFDAARGEFYYLFGFQEPFPRGQYNAWIMPSMVGGAGTWRNMFNAPNLKKFIQPTVCQVDYRRMGVCQACYDSTEHILVVSAYPLDQNALDEETTFKVKNLDEAHRYSVSADGKAHGKWRLRNGEMEITTTVDYHTYIIRET